MLEEKLTNLLQSSGIPSYTVPRTAECLEAWCALRSRSSYLRRTCDTRRTASVDPGHTSPSTATATMEVNNYIDNCWTVMIYNAVLVTVNTSKPGYLVKQKTDTKVF